MNPPVLTSIRRLKRIAPLQLGKILALLYGIMGLLFVPFLLFAAVFAPPVPAQQKAGLMVFSTGFAIMAPLLYAAMGFVFGAIGAVVYNLIAKWVGGIEVEVE